MIDLTNDYKEGVENILKWRNRYSPQEYPGKIALNIFYRKYTMREMWDDMLPYINHTPVLQFSEAQQKLQLLYGRTAFEKVHPVLIDNLTNHPETEVGLVSYSSMQEDIRSAANGDPKTRQWLEYSYLLHLLTDKLVIYWAAICATGVPRGQALVVATGRGIEKAEDVLVNYENVAYVALLNLAVPFMKTFYEPIP